MLSEVWIDRVLILAVSGLAAFLLALGVVRIRRAFTGRGGVRPPTGGRRFR